MKPDNPSSLTARADGPRNSEAETWAAPAAVGGRRRIAATSKSAGQKRQLDAPLKLIDAGEAATLDEQTSSEGVVNPK